MRGNFVTDKRGASNPNYKDGRKGTRLYRIYNGMKTRCYNPSFSSYPRYGGRGVKICEEWLNDFSAFRSWAVSHGYRDDLTIERLDVNGDYSPDNCTWADYGAQANNKTDNHLITYEGETKTLKQWSDFFGISDRTVRDRLRRGWDPVRAITTPSDPKYRKRVVI